MAQTAADSYKAEPKTKQFLCNVHVLQKPEKFYFSCVYFALLWPSGKSDAFPHASIVSYCFDFVTVAALIAKGTQFGYILHGKMP